MLVPHTIMCVGVKLFTEDNRGSATCSPYLVLLDVTYKVTPVSYMGYRGTSFIRNNTLLGPYSRTMPMILRRS